MELLNCHSVLTPHPDGAILAARQNLTFPLPHTQTVDVVRVSPEDGLGAETDKRQHWAPTSDVATPPRAHLEDAVLQVQDVNVVVTAAKHHAVVLS